MKGSSAVFPHRLIVVGLFFLPAANSCLADEMAYGSIEGRVVFKGQSFELEPLFTARPDIKDAEVCAQSDMPDERLVVERETRGVSHVFVWLKRKTNDPIHPDLLKVSPELPSLTFENCRLKPHALCVQTRTGFRMTSKDRVAHNPHDYPVRNPPGCFGLAPMTGKDELNGFIHNFNRAEDLPIRFTCDYHPWISAHVLVQDHPYMTVSNAGGTFLIDKIPQGTLEVRVWHSLGGYLHKDKVVLNSELQKLDDLELTIQPEQFSRLKFVQSATPNSDSGEN